MRLHGLQAGDRDLHMPGHHIGEGAGRTLVGYVHDIHAAFELEQLHREVLRSAATWRRVVQLSWLAFRELHQIRNTVRRERGMRYNEEGTRGDKCDGREALHRVERQALRERRRGAEGGGHEEQRMTVGRAARDEVGADVPGRARLVLRDHRDFPALGKPWGEQSREKVGAGAWRERNDEVDCARGEFLRDGQARRAGENERAERTHAAHYNQRS